MPTSEPVRAYRILTVKEVWASASSLNLSFVESNVNFVINREFLKLHFGLHRYHLIPGRKLLVRGRRGNEDADLCRVDPISEMYLFHEAPEQP